MIGFAQNVMKPSEPDR